jgi:TRAP-type C4-dicarboxylate transport system substrate-binding protein
MEIVELPFLYDDHVAASRALWATYDKHLKQEFPDVKAIAIWLTAMQQMHFRKPVAKLEDLSGMKIRAGGPTMADALRKLGAEGIIVPAPAIYERMQKGVLDGAIGAWGMLKAFKLGEVASDHLQVNITAAPLFVFMNQKKYDSLPDDVKKLFDAYSNEKTVAEFAVAFGRSDVAGKEIGASKGHTAVVLTAAERERWKKTVQPVVDAYLDNLEKRGLKAKAFHDTFLAEYEKRKGKMSN